MSYDPSNRRVVCRLLGGSGRPPLRAVRADKIPALLRPLRGVPAGAVDLRIEALPLAA